MWAVWDAAGAIRVCLPSLSVAVVAVVAVDKVQPGTPKRGETPTDIGYVCAKSKKTLV